MNLFQKKHDWILGGFEFLRADTTVEANPGSGGAVFAVDAAGVTLHPYAKMEFGASGTQTPVSTSNPLPVVQTGTPGLPTGAATAAKQDTGNTSLGTIAGAVAGSEMQVDIVTSVLPSGAATSAKQDTEITSLQILDDLVLAEDAAHVSGDKGVMALAVRMDSAASLAGTDGDYIPLTTDSTGALRVTGGSGGTQYAEDAAHSSGDTGTLALAVRRDTAASGTSADGDYGTLNTDASGRLWVNASGAAVPITDNSGSISVDDNGGALTVDNGGTFAVQVDGAALTALQLIDNIVFTEDTAASGGESGVPVLAVRRDAASSGVSADGDFANLSVDSTGALRVTGGGGGTQYQEDAAHSSGDTGTMSLAVRRDANTSLVSADGDYAPLQVDSAGSLKVAIISGAGSGGTSATDDAAFSVASGSGTPIMGLADETSPDSVDEGDVGVVRMTLTRALHVNLRDSSGNELSAGAQYAEDAAHTTGDLGTMMLTVRKDTAAATAGTDGDYQPPTTDASGRLHVNVGNTVNVASHAVTNAGTFAVQATVAAGATNIAKAEDAASADADVGVPAMAVRKATPANTSGTDGDYEMLQMSAGRLWASATIDAALPAGTNNIGDVDILSIAAGDNNIGNVDIVTMPNVTLAAGTNTNEVVGDAAHDAAVAGNPVRAGGRARTSDYASVANDDTADFITDLNGKQIVLPYAIPENSVSGAITSAMTGTTSTSLVAAPGAGLRNYITTIIVSNAHATVGTDVIIQDGNGGTTLLTIPAAAVYGGAVIPLPTPLRQPTANTALYCANVTTGASTKVSAVGFKAP